MSVIEIHHPEYQKVISAVVEESVMWRKRYLKNKGIDLGSSLAIAFLHAPCIYLSEVERSNYEAGILQKTPEGAMKIAESIQKEQASKD